MGDGCWVKGFVRAKGWAHSLEAEIWAMRDDLALYI